MMFDNFLARMRNFSLDSDAQNTVDDILNNMNVDAVSSSVDLTTSTTNISQKVTERPSRVLDIQNQCSQVLSLQLAPDGLVLTVLNYALTNIEHVMEANKQRLLFVFFSMMNYAVRKLINYDLLHQDFPLSVSEPIFKVNSTRV